VTSVEKKASHDFAPLDLVERPSSVAAAPAAPRSNGHAAGRGAIFVLPSTVTPGLRGPVASWVSTAGWAKAAHRVLGDAWLATPRGLVDPDDARRQASDPRLTAGAAPTWRRHVPVVAKRAVKDVRELLRARKFRVDPEGPWRASDVAFVWQRHELFHTAGLELARALGAPSVLFVPAPLVWESAQWGVHRPGWGGFVERYGEQPALRRADLIAAGSELVAEEVARSGIAEHRIVVTPSGVDLDSFVVHVDPATIREQLGLTDRYVIGWVGSFRRFHSLEQLIEAAQKIDGASLLLVGDGPERPRVEELAKERGVHAIFTGTVRHKYVASYLAAMDVGVLLAPSESAFHYSPLKLAEYVAAGLPVVAPRVAQVADRLTDGADAMLVEPSDPMALADSLIELREDPELRHRLSSAAHAVASTNWSWDNEVCRILAALD
jgi:glycosyltransferase involved in cell wall biosynthesis